MSEDLTAEDIDKEGQVCFEVADLEHPMQRLRGVDHGHDDAVVFKSFNN